MQSGLSEQITGTYVKRFEFTIYHRKIQNVSSSALATNLPVHFKCNKIQSHLLIHSFTLSFSPPNPREEIVTCPT